MHSIIGSNVAQIRINDHRTEFSQANMQVNKSPQE